MITLSHETQGYMKFLSKVAGFSKIIGCPTKNHMCYKIIAI